MATQVAPLMANARPRIIENKCIHIRRQMIGRGEITVSKGQEVAPYDILGRARLNSGYSSIHLSKQLGVSPEETLRYLKKPISSTVFKGELLADKKGLLFKKIILSPTDGIVDRYDQKTGELRLKFLSKEIPLTAGVFGVVDGIDLENNEVIIKTLATVIYGVIGFGFQRGGILNFVSDSTSPVQASRIDENMRQHILVAGALIFRDALKKAASLGIQGIISGGLNVADYKSMVGSLDINKRLENDVGITVLASEGFGPIPLGDDVFKVMKKHEGQFVFIDGNNKQLILPSTFSDSLNSIRKVSLPSEKSGINLPEILLAEVFLGSKVRIIWPPLMGTQGKVVGIDGSPTLLDSGISTYLVTVETSHKKVKVPFPNIELII